MFYGTVVGFLCLGRKKTCGKLIIHPVIMEAFAAYSLARTSAIAAITLREVSLFIDAFFHGL